MKIDISRFDDFAHRGKIVVGEWGDGTPETAACIMGALTGLTTEKQCVSEGWPLWLVQLFEFFNDNSPPDLLIPRMTSLAHACYAANNRGTDWDCVFRLFRLNSVLPLAMRSIGDGDEPWRVACREGVQWSIDHGGKANRKAAVAVVAAGAAGAAVAVGAAAITEMFDSAVEALAA